MFVQQCTIGAVTAQPYWSTRDIVLVSRVLQKHSGGCAGTKKYYKSTGEAVWL